MNQCAEEGCYDDSNDQSGACDEHMPLPGYAEPRLDQWFVDRATEGDEMSEAKDSKAVVIISACIVGFIAIPVVTLVVAISVRLFRAVVG